MAFLESLGVLLGDLESVHDVVGDMAAGEHQRGGVPDLALLKDGDVGGPAAQLHQGAAQFALVRRQHRERGRQRLEDELADPEPGPLDALLEVQQRAGQHRDQVYLGLEPGPGHPDRVGDPALLVDQVILRDGVQQFVVAAEGHVAGHVVHPGDVAGADLVAGDATTTPCELRPATCSPAIPQ